MIKEKDQEMNLELVILDANNKVIDKHEWGGMNISFHIRVRQGAQTKLYKIDKNCIELTSNKKKEVSAHLTWKGILYTLLVLLLSSVAFSIKLWQVCNDLAPETKLISNILVWILCIIAVALYIWRKLCIYKA